MSNTLSVKVTSRKNGEDSTYEGTVSIVGLKPTKLVRKADGSTQYPTKSAVSGAARNLAKALGYADIDVVDTTVVATTTKKVAAKKAATTTKTVNTTVKTVNTTK